MAKPPQSAVEVVFLDRTQNIYGSMTRRALKTYRRLPFTLQEFRDWLTNKFNGDIAGLSLCYYSDTPLTVETMEIDHVTPISRGGSFELLNLEICAKSENLRKGNMTKQEYAAFKHYVNCQLPEEVSESIWRRLQVGDVQRFAHFRRTRKGRGK